MGTCIILVYYHIAIHVSFAIIMHIEKIIIKLSGELQITKIVPAKRNNVPNH